MEEEIIISMLRETCSEWKIKYRIRLATFIENKGKKENEMKTSSDCIDILSISDFL
jgi:hypothetical protein